MKVIAFAVVVSCLLALSVAPFERGPIIDMHLHAFGFDEYGNPPPANEISEKVPAARTDDAAMIASLGAMREHGVVLAVASGRSIRCGVGSVPRMTGSTVGPTPGRAIRCLKFHVCVS